MSRQPLERAWHYASQAPLRVTNRPEVPLPTRHVYEPQEEDPDDFGMPGVSFRHTGVLVGLLLVVAVAFAIGMRYGKVSHQREVSDAVAMTGNDIDDAMPIPATHDAAMVKACERGWLVSEGDTMTRIAFAIHTTREALVSGNPQVDDPDKIYPGDIVCFRWKVSPPR